jgi:pimeloyl-ACP methyl ester carboxylesterase
MIQRWSAVAVVAMCAIAGAQSLRAGKTPGGIAYDVQGGGPYVILITGSNLDRRMWEYEASWLTKTHTVVRYDLRAHGQSDTATAPFSMLMDLVELMETLKIEKTALIGLSAGSAIALDAALAMPDRIDRIVLAGPAPSGYVNKVLPPFVAELGAALKAGDFKKIPDILLATPVFAAPPDKQPLVRQMVVENDRLWTVNRALMQPPKPAVDRLESVKVPTLVMIGDQDIWQREPAELLASRIPGAQIVRIKGGGHLLNLTSPVEFQSAVSAFLAKQGA